MNLRKLVPALAAGALFVSLTLFGPSAAQSAKPPSPKPAAQKVVLFASDGMRPDLMERYAAEGAMPTYAALMRAGVRGDNGLEQAFPPNTGVGWYTLATGTWPSEHGSTNNTFFRAGDAWNNRTSFSGSGVLQADTVAAAAERAGKKVAQIDWTGGAAAGIKGPTVDYTNFFSTRGVLATANAAEQAAAASFGISFQPETFVTASGWSGVPTSYTTALEGTAPLSVTSTFTSQYDTRLYNVYLYDSTNDHTADYDHVLLAPAKDGSAAVATLATGDWQNVKVGLKGTRAGQTAGFYVKLISADSSAFKLYFTSVARAIATCSTAACAALPGGLESYIADHFPSWVAADYAPLEARIIDENTYVQQARDLQAAYGNAVLTYILGTLQPDTDLALVGYSTTDEFQHQFLGLVTKQDMDGASNPTYDDVDYNGVPDGRVAVREGYLRSAYSAADAKLALARSLMGTDPTTFAASDHGFAAQWYAVNAPKVLVDAGLQGSDTLGNCRSADADLAKSCVAGGTAQIYVNPSQTGAAYENVRGRVIAAFQSLSDPANPGKQVVLKIMKKEELRNVDGTDALYPNRSGDVVIVLRPPYQFDAATAGKTIAYSNFFGQHGYLPDLVDLNANVNMHGTFVAAGPGIRHQGPVGGIRAIDVAPTISFLLDIPGPLNARGKILYQLFPDPGRWKEADILYISDFHGQLTPLSQTADTVGPSFAIGGAAYLKPWFDWYRADAPDGSITLSGGDAVGATPPISNFFGDKPTMNVLNMLGLSADTLGNHSFDRNSTYLRTQLIPLAQFPYLSANTVFASGGGYPPEWKPSQVFNFNGFKLGVVGFTLPELASLIFPGNLDPFMVTDPAAAINAEAAKLQSKGALDAVVAVGHMGVDFDSVGNTLPSSPLLQLADSLTGVDALLGGHTHNQYIGTQHGILVAESPNAGQRFTRIRLTVDTATKAVVYKTADFHKPWDIGVTPDPQIQSYVDGLNAQLAPLFSAVIGTSMVKVLRADACGRSDGRLCESLVGDIATDALRTIYGMDFAIENSGGLRADLTCPYPDLAGDFCPSFTPPPYPITRGSVLGVLPFGNVSFTVTVNGAELKSMLENGVSLMPSAQGRFPQVSGLCFTYDISKAPGSRVLGAVRQAVDGSCTGPAVDLTSASTYKIAENDFMATGGDGYPNVYTRGTTQSIMDQDVADYIGTHSPLSPTIQGRIVCTTSGTPACPVVAP